MTATVKLMGREYPLASTADPLPIDLRIRRSQISVAAQGLAPQDSAGMLLLMLAALGLLCRRATGVQWRTPIAAYGEAVWSDLLERCPPERRDELDREIVVAAGIAWRHLYGVVDATPDEYATEEGAASAADFSGVPRDGTPR